MQFSWEPEWGRLCVHGDDYRNYFGAQRLLPLWEPFPIIFLAAQWAFLAGFCYDRQGSYANAFYGLTALACIGAITVLIAKPPLASKP